MDDTMSSYSFSHQFYQRWTCAPEPIRAAITQELKDITTLLQNDTPFESFVFNTHDLDTHIDELYENHEAEQAIAKAITDKKAEEQATAEKQQREEQQKVKAAEDARLKESARLKEAADTAQKEQQKTEQIAAEKKNIADKTIAMNANDASDSESLSIDNTVEKNQNVEKSAATQSSSENKTISEHANVANDKHINDDHSIKAVNDKASAAIKLALKDAKLSTTHQEMIRELEMQIDDYLSEQMMLMSENLKSWLRAEVTQNLSEDEAVTDKESKKS
ncbi:hypothetical protein C8D84_11411 [Psychrobacter immobilis]|uniref:Uncharacterized protein n=1 Tax=Psychrobacter immobilis TaxID=498 RepID=A0A2V1ZI70_PSYIM|nr:MULTISPECIES: hypothetical protein [Psychrobacter]MCG3809090.1 hypothetical protein [Psychrobacter sp. Ps4]PWK07771.1 hypothetical protein C8D84_11411 [Psychrobacter immobilis]